MYPCQQAQCSKRSWWVFIGIVLILRFAPACGAEDSIVPNFNFSMGITHPASWEVEDRFKPHTRLVKDLKANSRCLEFTVTRGQSVGTGVYVMSDFFPIKMDQEYIFSVDAQGKANEIFTWVYGYTTERKREGKTESYRAQLHLIPEWTVPLPGAGPSQSREVPSEARGVKRGEEKVNPEGWVRYQRRFTVKGRKRKSKDPSKRRSIDIEWARVKLWTCGLWYSSTVVRFDNVIVRPVER